MSEGPAPTPTRYLLLWLDSVSEIDGRTLVPVRRQIEDLVMLPRDEVEIDIWLESPGGDAHSAYKLALLLRNAACHVRVIVPDYAKSAATLLALVGDEIFLAPAAELGPLDAQMPEEGSLSGAISALNIARAADAVASDAVALAGTGGAELLHRTGLSRAETLNAMLRFSAEFSEPLVRQLDPKLVHHAKELLRVTARYAERLLVPTVGPRAESIAKRLVENFPTHGFVIAYDDAHRLGLPVRPIEEYDHLDLVRSVHRSAEDFQSFIEFMSMSDFVEARGGDDDDEATEAEESTDAEDEAPVHATGAGAVEGGDSQQNGTPAPADGHESGGERQSA